MKLCAGKSVCEPGRIKGSGSLTITVQRTRKVLKQGAVHQEENDIREAVQV